MDFERTGRFRATFLCGALIVLLVAMSVRLAHIQLFHGETYASGARRQQVARREVSAPRGRILDREGRLLAVSVPARSLYADPGEVEDVEWAAARTASLLEIPEGDLVSLLRRPGRFVWLRRRVEDRVLLGRITKLGLPWIGQTFEPARRYPAGRIAAPVLGFVGDDGHGLEGLEAALERRLRPCPGYRYEEHDGVPGGLPIRGTIAGDREPCAGKDVRLTVDLRIQAFAEEALDELVKDWRPRDATAVVLDPRTGDILASATRPDFDPTRPLDSPKEAWRNRVALDTYAPGSSFKPLVAALALDARVVGPDETIDCEGGARRFGSRLIKDHHKMGRVPFPQVLIHSSNIGMVKIARRLGCSGLHDGLVALGLGRRTGCGYPGEAEGLVTPRSRWKENWTLTSVAFGQELAVTPLQLARAFCALATDGRMPRPRYLLDGGEPVQTRVFRARTAAIVRETMGRVVEEGTGKPVRLKTWRVGGKTGTADHLEGGRKIGYTSVFAGIAPLSDPRFVVVVMADLPRTDRGTPYGSRVAAPAVKSILERSLRLVGAPADAR